MSDTTMNSVEELREIAEALVLSGLRAQEKAEAAAQSAKRLRSLVDGLHAIIWEADAVAWQYTFISQRAKQFLGYPVDYWLTRRDFWAEVIHPQDRVKTMERWRAGIETGEPFNLEYRAITSDNRLVSLRNMVSVIRNAEGHPQRLHGVIVDISDLDHESVSATALHLSDHRISEMLQRSMLLKPDMARFTSLEIEAFYEPCWDEAQVGGDFFDVFVPSPGKVALVVGDVCGKGLVAAARTVQVKYALRAFMYNEHPEVALSRLNQYLASALELDSAYDAEFVALSMAVVDQLTGEAVFVSAGAEPPLIARNGRAVLAVDVGGLTLGVLPDASYAATVLQLDPGDTLLMLTDGLTEARRDNLFLNPEGIAGLASEALFLPLKEMGQQVLDGARAFGLGRFRDDVCMLVARRR